MKIGLEDNDLMPMGKHKGTPMCNVPAGYLVWFYKSVPVNSQTRDIHDYINDIGIEELKKENQKGNGRKI